MLVLQLFAGEDQKHDIFTNYYHCEDTFHFRWIQKTIEKRIPTVVAAFDTIEKDLKGKPAPGWGNCSKASTSPCCRKRHRSPKNAAPNKGLTN